MGRKAGSRQLKRAPSPAFWPIHRKEASWAPMTRPGPHPRRKSLPLVLVLREMLGYARTAAEAKKMIKSDNVKVDGVTRRDHRFPVGLMDVVSVQDANQSFRVLPKRGGGLRLSPIEPTEVNFKICKVIGKQTVNKGGEQLSLHDGRNIIYNVKDSQRLKLQSGIPVGTSLHISIPEQRIIQVIMFEPGTAALVTDGRNQGIHGRLAQITPGSYARQKMVKLESETEALETPAHYVMTVGTDAPLVNLR